MLKCNSKNVISHTIFVWNILFIWIKIGFRFLRTQPVSMSLLSGFEEGRKISPPGKLPSFLQIMLPNAARFSKLLEVRWSFCCQKCCQVGDGYADSESIFFHLLLSCFSTQKLCKKLKCGIWGWQISSNLPAYCITALFHCKILQWYNFKNKSKKN